MRDIVLLGDGANCEDLYWLYVITIISNPYDNMVWLDDKGIDYESVSAFSVFCLKWLDAKSDLLSKEDNGKLLAFAEKVFPNSLSFFLGERNYDLRISHGVFEIYDVDNPKWFIGEEVFDLVHDFICAINRLDSSSQIKPATKMAKQMLIDDMRLEQKKRKKRKRRSADVEYIGEAISSIMFGGSNANIKSIMDLGVYSVLNGGSAVNNKIRVSALLNGVYTNKIKADSISSEDLRWSK